MCTNAIHVRVSIGTLHWYHQSTLNQYSVDTSVDTQSTHHWHLSRQSVSLLFNWCVWVSRHWANYSPNPPPLLMFRWCYIKVLCCFNMTYSLRTITGLWCYIMKNDQLWNWKHALCFYQVIETWVGVWENEKCCGNTSRQASVSTAFSISPRLPRVFLLNN